MSTVHHHPIGPTAYDHLMSELIDSRRRAVRMETRLVKLMEHFGLDESGHRDSGGRGESGHRGGMAPEPIQRRRETA